MFAGGVGVCATRSRHPLGDLGSLRRRPQAGVLGVLMFAAGGIAPLDRPALSLNRRTNKSPRGAAARAIALPKLVLLPVHAHVLELAYGASFAPFCNSS